MNPLYKDFSNNQFSMIAKQAKEFQKTLTGDPRQIVQNMMNTGKMSQQQFNELAQIANQVMPYFK